MSHNNPQGRLLGGSAAVLAVLWSICVLGTARAEEYPRISGEVLIEVQNDWSHDSDDPANELNDLFTTTEPDINVHANEWLYVNAHLTLEPVFDPDPGDDRFFEDHGLFVEALSINVERDRFQAFAGKFGPNFSIAFDAAPGIYGTDIAEDDIEMSERVGFGGAIALGNERVGAHTVSGSVFFADTSVLSESVINNRGRVKKRDGGPSNTESLESFVIALDGEEIPNAPGLRYHIGFARQTVDRVLDDTGSPIAGIDDEYRVVAAAEWRTDLSDDIAVTPLLEYAHFWNAVGIDSETRDYITASSLLEYGNWNLALSYTGRFIDDDAGPDFNDSQFQISGGYTFDFGLEADVGWKISDEANIETQTLGLFLTYLLEF